MDDGLVEVLVVIRHIRRILWIPQVLVIPPSLSSAGKVYDGFQLHRNINQPTRKEHPDDSKLAQDCTVRIVRRKGKSAPYREVWWERWLVGQGATLCGCRCGDSGWIIEAMSVRRVAAIDHGFNRAKRAMYATERFRWRFVELGGTVADSGRAL